MNCKNYFLQELGFSRVSNVHNISASLGNQQLTLILSSGQVAHLVTCLATDACLTADPGVVNLIPAWSNTFVEIGHEIIAMVILLPSADLFKNGCFQL